MAVTNYAALKSSGLGDIFVFPLSLTRTHPALFQTDLFDFEKRTGMPKGVLEVEI